MRNQNNGQRGENPHRQCFRNEKFGVSSNVARVLDDQGADNKKDRGGHEAKGNAIFDDLGGDCFEIHSTKCVFYKEADSAKGG